MQIWKRDPPLNQEEKSISFTQRIIVFSSLVEIKTKPKV